MKQWAEERLTALPNIVHGLKEADRERQKALQGHRKVDETVKILLTANSGEKRLMMKSGFFESAPVGS